MGGEQERLGDGLQDFLFGLRIGEIRVEEVLLGLSRRTLQIVDPVNRMDCTMFGRTVCKSMSRSSCSKKSWAALMA